MPKIYTSQYFFERLKQIQQTMRTLKSYKPLKELMAAKETMPEMSPATTRQGLEK